MLNKKLLNKYHEICVKPGDLCEHVPFLKGYAQECNSVLELGGGRYITSTVAFMMGLRENSYIDSLDIAGRHIDTDTIEELAKGSKIDFTFHQADSLKWETNRRYDILFVDSLHIYGQLKKELEKFAPLIDKYIIMHDTATDGERGEVFRYPEDSRDYFYNLGFSKEDVEKGLTLAIDEFLEKNDDWRTEQILFNCNGLTVLKRC